MHLLKRSAGDDRGWKHTFWAWMGSRWKEFTALAQGPNSWLCWYDSLTRQPTRVPDSSRKHYESHHRRPSVCYLHVFKSTACSALDRYRAINYCRHCVKNFLIPIVHLWFSEPILLANKILEERCKQKHSTRKWNGEAIIEGTGASYSVF